MTHLINRVFSSQTLRLLLIMTTLCLSGCALTPQGVVGGVLGATAGALGGAAIARNNNVEPGIGAVAGAAAGWALGSRLGDHIAYRRQGFQTRAQYIEACRQASIRANTDAIATRDRVSSRLPQVRQEIAQAKQSKDNKGISAKEKEIKQMRGEINKQRGNLKKESEAQVYALKLEGDEKDKDWYDLQNRLKSLEVRQEELAAQDRQLESTLAQTSR